MPNENLLYVADSLYTPYGDKSDQQIETRVLKIADFLNTKKVKAIVVACNTATAAAIKNLREKYQIPIIGLEPALKPAVNYSPNGRIGVLATRSTLESEKYQTLRSRFDSNIELTEKASPLFVELVENTPVIGKNELKLIEDELHIFKQSKIDSLVLGCTHYPFLTQAIDKILGPQVTLFESGKPVAKELNRRLQGVLNLSEIAGNIQYFSSDPERTQKMFEQILEQKILLNKF